MVVEASFEGGASLYREGVDESTGAGTGQPVCEELCRQGWSMPARACGFFGFEQPL